MSKVETRVPVGSQWVKLIIAVSETAKSGRDWEGEWLKSERLADLEPGCVVAACNNAGSRKQPHPGVRLCAMRHDGSWVETSQLDSLEWGYELRALARDLLAASDDPQRQTVIILDREIAAAREDLEKRNAYYETWPSSREQAMARLNKLIAQRESVETTPPAPPVEILRLAAELRAALDAEKQRYPAKHHAHEAIVDALQHLDSVDRCIQDIEPDHRSDEEFARDIGALKNE